MTKLIESHDPITTPNDTTKKCLGSKFIFDAKSITHGSVVRYFNDVADLELMLSHKSQ